MHSWGVVFFAVLDAKHSGGVAFKKGPILFAKMLLEELFVYGFRVYVDTCVVALSVEREKIYFWRGELASVN